MAKKAKKIAAKPKPRVHKDLQGLDITIDQFGEIKANMNIEKLNEFLDKNVDDKKLAERDDYDDMKKGEQEEKMIRLFRGSIALIKPSSHNFPQEQKQLA